MTWFEGGCHCGDVRFRVDVEPEFVGECDCSVCTRKGILHIAVPESRFELLAGEDALRLYTFGTGAASHWFCTRCGIHPFGRPRTDPGRYTVNARCLDQFHAVFAALPVRNFDGRNHPLDRTS